MTGTEYEGFCVNLIELSQNVEADVVGHSREPSGVKVVEA